MQFIKITPFIFCFFFLTLVSCGDDTSSGSSDNPSSSSEGPLFDISSSSKPVEELSSFIENENDLLETPLDTNCVSGVFPNVMVDNIESVNVKCDEGTSGWLILLKDKNTLLKCIDGNWFDRQLNDC